MAVGTSVFLAGAEVETLTRALLDNGVRNILYSYFYILTMRRERFIESMMEQYPDVNWFLDSGAFTYGMKFKSEPEKLPPLKQYIRRYFAYIDAQGHRYCRITEPDMDIAGQSIEQVEEWREEMLERWPHLNVTPVWHQHRGTSDWYEYLEDKRIKTLAIGSGSLSNSETGLIRRLLMNAAYHGKPVHGFGMTRINTMLKHLPFDSVDSTTWVMGQKAGITFIFRNNKFITLPMENKHQRIKYKSYFRNIGCDPKLVIEDDVAEVRKANIIAWRALADRLETIKRRGRQAYGVDNTVFAVRNARDAGHPGGRDAPPPVPALREGGSEPRDDRKPQSRPGVLASFRPESREGLSRGPGWRPAARGEGPQGALTRDQVRERMVFGDDAED